MLLNDEFFLFSILQAREHTFKHLYTDSYTRRDLTNV